MTKTSSASSSSTAKKTCPCCFRQMTVKCGSIVRHGWRESGGRRVGQVGNVWQMGSCFGARGYAPLEVSCDGTVAYRAALTETRARMAADLETLRARPAVLRCSYETGGAWSKKTVTVELADDGVKFEDVCPQNDSPKRDERWCYSPRHTVSGSYGWHLLQQTNAAVRSLRDLDAFLVELTGVIENWKAAA